MRIGTTQLTAILESARLFFGDSCRVILFGSRLDDSAKGGDIDLLIESNLDMRTAVRMRWKFLAHLCARIGERSIDVVLTQGASKDPRAVVKQALSFGVTLCQP